MKPVHRSALADVTGGLYYGEQKSPSGEKWAAEYDAQMKVSFEAHTKDASALRKNVEGLLLLPRLAVGETARRAWGHISDVWYGTESKV